MRIEIDKFKVQQMKQWQIDDYLRDRGMDTTKEIIEYECPSRLYSRIFVGESLADKVVGCIKTVVGLVPITEPWEAT